MIENDLDQGFLQSLKKSDQSALAQMFQKYSDLLLKYGMSITQDKDLVKDSVQELFINIWNQRQNISVTRSLKLYLIISLRRIILRKLEKERTHSTTQLEAYHSDHLNEKDPETRIVEREHQLQQHQLLQNEINNLPKRQREVIHLRFYEELNFEEIGAIMELNYQGVRNILYKSVKALRARLIDNSNLLSLLISYLGLMDFIFNNI